MHAGTRLLLRTLVAACLVAVSFSADTILPGTEPLTMQGDLSALMVEGVNRFLTAQTKIARDQRAQYWHRDFSSPQSFEQSIATNRARLKYLIGATDARVPFREMNFVASTTKSSTVAATPEYTVHAIRWPVLPGVTGEGLWLEPRHKTLGTVIAIPDADQTPEMICGLALGLNAESQFARKLVEGGAEVFVPVLINRSDMFSGNAELNRFTNQPHREWIYRQAYELGRHIIGYEVQKVLALVDWAAQHDEKTIAVAGYGEGGLIALYSAALDTRINSAMVSGYFGPRERMFEEPIYRNVFGFLREFGDAEVASLIAPRTLVVEYSECPKIDGPPAPRPGRSGAAPGRIWTPEHFEVEDELNRAREFFPEKFPTHFLLVQENEGRPVAFGSNQALELAVGWKAPEKSETAPEPRFLVDAEERQGRQVRELVNFTQHQITVCERERNENFWRPLSVISADQWAARREPVREALWNEVIGRFDEPVKEMHPRSRRIYDNPKWTGYEVVLDVWPDVFAWGILLVPKNLEPGERRPVVVCQHGLEGVPKDTIEGPDPSNPGAYAAYKSFAARLADQGFITFAPHNPYRGHDDFRVLQRKSNPLGRTLFSSIIGQHEQILNWLQSLPFVAPDRIGFYGLSYGGKSAMRIPAVLDRYALSICSADFNDWVRKCSTVDSPYSYMFSMEYDMPEFALGPRFNYAEMAAVIAPRPFMVERGHNDGVAPDEWVAYEYAKVRRFYDALGIGKRSEIEFFNGPHTINGQGTFRFLHEHLNFPEKAK
jgi:dienelactone hydrolase